MTDHPITPSPELVQQWINEEDGLTAGHIATRAAQWGADQELEACCSLLVQQGFDLVDYLRAARRPKPPSLKEQALKELDAWTEERNGPGESLLCDGLSVAIIRRALEQLDD
jgi:hypothetical protein